MNNNHLYALYLNGRLYGKGKYGYIQELIKDYVYACDMYGEHDVDFKIKKLNYKEE